MQSHSVELIASEWLSLRDPLSTPPVLPASQTPHHEVVHFVKFPVRIPWPEIIPPASKNGRRFRNNLLHVFPALSSASQLPNPFTESLCRLRTRPPLHEIRARFPLYAPLLSNRAAQKHKALLPGSQVHQLRLRRMQRQSRPAHHQPDPPERFLGLRFRSAHRHEIIGIPDQYAKLLTPSRPDPIQLVQVDVGHQREITPPRGVPARVSLTVPSSITPLSSHWRINFNTLRSEIRSFTNSINMLLSMLSK